MKAIRHVEMEPVKWEKIAEIVLMIVVHVFHNVVMESVMAVKHVMTAQVIVVPVQLFVEMGYVQLLPNHVIHALATADNVIQYVAMEPVMEKKHVMTVQVIVVIVLLQIHFVVMEFVTEKKTVRYVLMIVGDVMYIHAIQL